jgi:hypothetical protein
MNETMSEMEQWMEARAKQLDKIVERALRTDDADPFEWVDVTVECSLRVPARLMEVLRKEGVNSDAREALDEYVAALLTHGAQSEAVQGVGLYLDSGKLEENL